MTNRMIRFSSNEDATRVLRLGRPRSPARHPGSRRPSRFYDPKRRGGLWVGKSYGREDAYRRDPIGHLSHGATAFQVARLYYLLESGASSPRRSAP